MAEEKGEMALARVAMKKAKQITADVLGTGTTGTSHPENMFLDRGCADSIIQVAHKRTRLMKIVYAIITVMQNAVI